MTSLLKIKLYQNLILRDLGKAKLMWVAALEIPYNLLCVLEM